MEIGALQFDPVWENPAANFAAVEAALAGADPPLPAGSLLVLPELFACGFSMNVAQAADGPAAETETFLACLARRFSLTVLGGVGRQLPDGTGANEALAFGPDGALLARYRKIHLFSPAGESQAFTPGEKVVTFPWNGFTVAPVICYDLRFPELFRAGVEAGADLFCVIASWPERRHAHWTTLLRARAIENQAFVLGVNRTGADPHASYAGGSVLHDPQGAVVADGGSTPTLLRAAISPAAVQSWRDQFPALRDRRPDLFSA